MANRRRYLPGNASSEIPSNLLFFDTESHIHKVADNKTELTLRLWTAQSIKIRGLVTSAHRYYQGQSKEEFWELVDQCTNKSDPLWIIAHNARFDFRQLQMWGEFDSGRFLYKSRLHHKRHSIFAIDSLPWFIRCQHRNKATVWMLDTQNYWKMTLEELGKLVNLDKIEVDFENVEYDALLARCIRDVDIIRKAFCQLCIEWRQRDLGNFRTSSAGLALQNYKHFHCGKGSSNEHARTRFDILCDPDSPITSYERDGYYGGRIEAFYIGTYKGKVYNLDIRSCYPSIMRDGLYPIMRSVELSEPKPEDVFRLIPAYGVMATVLINTSKRTYPLRYKKRQIHATGNFWTVLCGSELERALDCLDVVAISKAQVYKTAPLFKEWCDYWLEVRDTGERMGLTSMTSLSKLISNALHGKFGQRGVRWIDSDRPMSKNPDGTPMRWGMFLSHNMDTKKSVQCRTISGQVQEHIEDTPPDHCFPAISAMICADVRERMSHLISLCPADSVLYTAVDSLIVTEPGYKALLLAGELAKNNPGKLNVKGEHEECEIVSQGVYRLDDEWTASGLFGKAEMDHKNEWFADSWTYNDLFSFDDDGVVTINRLQVQKPRGVPKGDMKRNGFLKPFTIRKDEEFYRLPIDEQRKILFETG